MVMNQGDDVTPSIFVVMVRQPPSKRQVAGSNPAGVAKDANSFLGSWSFPIEDLGLPVALTEGALEPSTWAMMLLGCEPGLCGLSRKRQRHRFDAGNTRPLIGEMPRAKANRRGAGRALVCEPPGAEARPRARCCRRGAVAMGINTGPWQEGSSTRPRGGSLETRGSCSRREFTAATQPWLNLFADGQWVRK